jgi:hypothetical protein
MKIDFDRRLDWKLALRLFGVPVVQPPRSVQGSNDRGLGVDDQVV